jgi:hypothetical protein
MLQYRSALFSSVQILVRLKKKKKKKKEEGKPADAT